MKKMYAIETLTNLHVGAMDDILSIVDKTVQRDATTGYPAIFATSLKGALRGAAEADADAKACVTTVFGSENVAPTTQGTYVFHEAHLLLYPVRSLERPYYLASCPAMLRDAARITRIAGEGKWAEAFGALAEAGGGVLLGDAQDGSARAEHCMLNRKQPNDNQRAGLDALKRLTGENSVAILHDGDMGRILEELPVVARNKLDTGISKTLWYEEFVPRRSFFLTMIYSKAAEDARFTKFLNESAERPITVGANATVGYGLCQFRTLPGTGGQANA